MPGDGTPAAACYADTDDSTRLRLLRVNPARHAFEPNGLHCTVCSIFDGTSSITSIQTRPGSFRLAVPSD